MKNAVFLQPAKRYRATDIFDGCKPLKMGAIRKPRFQTGRLYAAERRDACERRSDGDVEKTMDGFFNNLLGICADALLQPFRNDLCNTRVNQVPH